jgi:hypothetical protein
MKIMVQSDGSSSKGTSSSYKYEAGPSREISIIAVEIRERKNEVIQSLDERRNYEAIVRKTITLMRIVGSCYKK